MSENIIMSDGLDRNLFLKKKDFRYKFTVTVTWKNLALVKNEISAFDF